MIEGPPSPLAWMVMSTPPEVVPGNDIVAHTPGMRCWCNPWVDEQLTIVHNAKDGRDDYIEKRRRPS